MRESPLAQLIRCALSYQASAMYDDVHPENPHGDAELELKQDALDEAVVRYSKTFDKPGTPTMEAAPMTPNGGRAVIGMVDKCPIKDCPSDGQTHEHYMSEISQARPTRQWVDIAYMERNHNV